jgi:type IV secretion system protein TrbC
LIGSSQQWLEFLGRREHRETKHNQSILDATANGTSARVGGGHRLSRLTLETPLALVARSLTGPVALSIAIVALMAAGGILVFGGELNEFARRACIAVLAIAFLVAGSGFMTALFGISAALV